MKNDGYEVSLEPRKFYVAIVDLEAASRSQMRVVDESGEDYLFPVDYFARPSVSRNLARLLQRAV